jgi:predicted nucleic acid-binding protein
VGLPASTWTDSVATLTQSPGKTTPRVPDARPERGLLDTSVIIELEHLDPAHLPLQVAICSLTLAELAAGPHAAPDPTERARRQDRLQRVEATFDPLPFDLAAARAYGRVYAAVHAVSRKPRGARAVDLMIAATALSHDLPLYTRDADGFRGLDGVVDLHVV